MQLAWAEMLPGFITTHSVFVVLIIQSAVVGWGGGGKRQTDRYKILKTTSATQTLKSGGIMPKSESWTHPGDSGIHISWLSSSGRIFPGGQWGQCVQWRMLYPQVLPQILNCAGSLEVWCHRPRGSFSRWNKGHRAGERCSVACKTEGYLIGILWTLLGIICLETSCSYIHPTTSHRLL